MPKIEQLLFSISVLPRSLRQTRCHQTRWLCSTVSTSSASGDDTQRGAGLRARARRREVGKARVAAHLSLKREIEARRQTSEDLRTVFISIPPFVRERCCLTNRLARVKTILPRTELDDTGTVRRVLSGVLMGLFPETKSLLHDENAFELRIAGREIVDPISLHESVQMCETKCDSLFIEIVPHNLPPPKKPYSERWVKARMRDTSTGLLRMVSFYKFHEIDNPGLIAERLKKIWGLLGIRGRVYVAKEGVNAQMAVPEMCWRDFVDAMRGDWIERDVSVVPPFLCGVYLNEDGSVSRAEQPFDALHVRVREKVLADGLSSSFDWSSAGTVLTPEQWHQQLEEAGDAIVVDCRNKYETEVGHFEGAETPNTQTFRDTWSWLENRLADVDRDRPVMTYCTGGIRCVKVNAYLEQKMGFRNTKRLGGGIVSYARKLEKAGRIGESKFRGINHVFDGRVGREITNDTLSRCLNCDQLSDVQTDCAYVACKRPFDTRMFVQCADCAARLGGACSQECCDAIRSGAQDAKRKDNGVLGQQFSYQLDEDDDSMYADEFSSSKLQLFREIREISNQRFEGRTHMLSGPMQGAFLNMLVGISGAKRVLELGSFLAYSALCMMQALPRDGCLITCESDGDVAAAAQQILNRHDGQRVQLKVCPAMTLLEELNGRGTEPFDLVFVDANKGGYTQYYEYLLTHGLVRSGSVMAFDNVLFKKLVSSEYYNRRNLQAAHHHMIRRRQRSYRKAHRIATKLHKFNTHVREDSRTEQVLLPLRDGLLVVRVC